jgi:UDP-N-acetylmuramoyl-L-alanyl-D-glutamate--2,6-diaminopimelate ligase
MQPIQTTREEPVPKFLLSDFNAENVAVAVAIAKELGIPNQFVEEALVNFEGVPGRMEFITAGSYTAVVDYAHTPDSLEAAYRAVKPAPNATYRDPKLICVLGAAGGGRDRWKRPAMGTIASDYCDEIILTNEDPYNEDPRSIIHEIRSGILGGEPDLANVYEILDRNEAIKKAVNLMKAGDVVIGTGKGSEDWIHVARGGKIPWSEREAFEAALHERKFT